MQSNKGRRWAILQLMVLLQGFIPQQLRLMLLWEKYVNRAFTHFIINLIHQRRVNMNFSQSILFTPNVILLRTSPTSPLSPCR